MLKSLSHKNKFILLLVSILLVLILAYQFSFSRTIKAITEVNNYEKQLDELTNAPDKIEVIKNDLFFLNQSIGNQTIERSDFQENLLDVVTGFCQENKVQLKGVKHLPMRMTKAGLRVQTTQLEIKGRFKKLTELIYSLENEKHVGRIINSTYEASLNRSKRVRELVLTLYVQNIIKE